MLNASPSNQAFPPLNRLRSSSVLPVVCTALGFAATLYGASWFAADANELPIVSVVDGSVGSSNAPSARWAISLVAVAVGMALIAFQRRGSRGWDVIRLGWSAILMMWSWLLAHALWNAQIFDRDNHCRHRDCAPGDVQAVFLIAPLMLALAVAAVTAAIPRRWARPTMAIWASCTFIVADVVQLLVWRSHAIPFLQGLS